MLCCVALLRYDVSEEHIATTANIVPSLPILVTLMMMVIRSSEMSVLTRITWGNIPEDGILHNHHCENLKYLSLSPPPPNPCPFMFSAIHT
jgi:hypothetical protein